MNEENQLANAYDRKYLDPNFFGNRRWLYLPFAKALLQKAELGPGTRLLDAGCGQGFFTGLFAELGVDALGVDLSSVGIEAAKKSCAFSRARFQVGDILQLPFREEFDCVFTRSCSLYNTTEFSHDTGVTDHLIGYVRRGGVLIFDYYSRLSPRDRADSWLYHSLAQVREHFAKYHDSKTYFSLRFDAWVPGGRGFSPITTRIASFLSRVTGLGGELVVFVRVDRG